MPAAAKPPKVTAIIQARMGSTRLPGKSMMRLGDKTIIQLLVERVRRARRVTEVVVAIPDTERDDALQIHLEELGTACFRGSETDVLGRFYECAKMACSDHAIRLTGDAPFLAPGIIDEVVGVHLANGYDYTSNGWQELRTFPLGLDVRVLTFAVLEKINQCAVSAYDREHVTTYIHSHLSDFKYGIVQAEGIWHQPEIELVINDREDYQMIHKLYEKFKDGAGNIDVEAVIALLRDEKQ